MRKPAPYLVVSLSTLIVACSSHGGREPIRTRASPLAAATVSGFAAPACLEEAPGCSSGLLLAGPDTTGPELNAPNTLDVAWCPDVALDQARYAVQGIAVSTPQGASMQQSRPIDVEVTVSTPPDEFGVVQLWYSTSAESPTALQWMPNLARQSLRLPLVAERRGASPVLARPAGDARDPGGRRSVCARVVRRHRRH